MLICASLYLDDDCSSCDWNIFCFVARTEPLNELLDDHDHDQDDVHAAVFVNANSQFER